MRAPARRTLGASALELMHTITRSGISADISTLRELALRAVAGGTKRS